MPVITRCATSFAVQGSRFREAAKFLASDGVVGNMPQFNRQMQFIYNDIVHHSRQIITSRTGRVRSDNPYFIPRHSRGFFPEDFYTKLRNSDTDLAATAPSEQAVNTWYRVFSRTSPAANSPGTEVLKLSSVIRYPSVFVSTSILST